MRYLLFANQNTGSPILKKLSAKPPSVVVTFLSNTDSLQRLLKRIFMNRITVEDRVRYLKKIEFYDYFSLSEKRLTKIIKKHNIEVGFITTFRKILPKKYLDLFPRGVYNFHPSILPDHGGPEPFFWIVYNEDHYSGTTCHQATNVVDCGKIVLQSKYFLRNTNSKYLFNRYVKDVQFMISELLDNFDILERNAVDMHSVNYDEPIPDLIKLKKVARNDKNMEKKINRALKLFNRSI